ncbi:hypothetical protein [Ferrimonas gelatinilytica]|uniref:Uncharacterized protein n=1 Tax=Ferrimonas gelatinilytica TaxID=1255257 RepID=A0ABP9RY54_9GAMM
MSIKDSSAVLGTIVVGLGLYATLESEALTSWPYVIAAVLFIGLIMMEALGREAG